MMDEAVRIVFNDIAGLKRLAGVVGVRFEPTPWKIRALIAYYRAKLATPSDT